MSEHRLNRSSALGWEFQRHIANEQAAGNESGATALQAIQTQLAVLSMHGLIELLPRTKAQKDIHFAARESVWIEHERVRVIRQAQGLDQTAFGEQLRLSQAAISLMESGKKKGVPWYRAVEIASVLNIEKLEELVPDPRHRDKIRSRLEVRIKVVKDEERRSRLKNQYDRYFGDQTKEHSI